jgi:hypothetical protein
MPGRCTREALHHSYTAPHQPLRIGRRASGFVQVAKFFRKWGRELEVPAALIASNSNARPLCREKLRRRESGLEPALRWPSSVPTVEAPMALPRPRCTCKAPAFRTAGEGDQVRVLPNNALAHSVPEELWAILHQGQSLRIVCVQISNQFRRVAVFDLCSDHEGPFQPVRVGGAKNLLRLKNGRSSRCHERKARA